MSKVLVISGHPNISYSTANRIILEELAGTAEVTIIDIIKNYPAAQTDVERDQRLLKQAALIIFQFPFVWYGLASHVKRWVETVFCDGFAFGPGGNKLTGKSVLLSFTTGGTAQDYTANGKHRHAVETFLVPLQLQFSYCGLRYLPPVYSCGMSVAQPEHRSAIQQKALVHAARLKERISQFLSAGSGRPVGGELDVAYS
jgi:putative NADPH-quinone reductase